MRGGGGCGGGGGGGIFGTFFSAGPLARESDC